jgi:signal transduction histidine kinase/CheY-like chemotaxis protein
MTARKKKGQHISWLLRGSVVLLLVLLAVCSAFFYSSMKEQMYRERQSHLSELTIKISEILNKEMEDRELMADSARNLMNLTSGDSAPTSEKLRTIRDILGVSEGELFAVNSRSIFYTSNGYYARWSTPEDLTEEDGIPLIRELTIDGDKETYMVFLRSLPENTSFDEDGTPLTHVVLAIPLADMDEEFSISGFGGNCYTYLINTSGRRLYRQTFSDTFIEEFNVLSALKDCRFTMDGTVEELENAIRNQENACLEFRLSGTRDYYFVSTVPIGNTEWAVLVFVSSDVLGQSSSGVMSSLIRYIIFICCIILVTIGLLIYISSWRRGERKLMEQQEENNILLEQAAKDATKASQAKTEFLSHMSHDIRTPINGIVGMANIARKNITNPTRLEDCLNKINRASDHLLSLLNDVLEMSRIESGRIEIAHKPINLQNIIENCCTIIESQLITRNIEFRTEVDITHATLLGDELRLRQIFINILGNSIKFTPDGGTIVFRVKEQEESDGKAHFLFEIEDNGIGMSEEFQEHIFEPFSQEENGSRTDYQGAGLGMAITSQFVNMMGGTIRVKSRVGEGTTFYVEMRFPIALVEAQQLCSPEDCHLEGMRVLLVEDNELNREIAEELLKDVGVNVTIASDGKQALDMFTDSAPGSFDAILMDIMMPNMNGYEAAKAIRAGSHADAQTIPIIAMTANAYVEDVAQALASGMNAHVAKPIDVQHLYGVLNQYYRTGDTLILQRIIKKPENDGETSGGTILK